MAQEYTINLKVLEFNMFIIVYEKKTFFKIFVNISSKYYQKLCKLLYLLNSKFEMNENFVIKNNYSELKSSINIEKDCKVEKIINCAIRGGQLYLNNSKCKINGGLIQNSNNLTLPNFTDKESFIKEKKIDIACQEGAINFINCKNKNLVFKKTENYKVANFEIKYLITVPPFF